MASILAHIGSLQSNSDLPSGVKPWDGSLGFCNNVFNYPVEDQFRLFIDQIVAALYYRVFYGQHCNYIVTEYINELTLAFLTRLYPAASREFAPGSERAKLLEQVANVVSYLREGYWKRPPGDADDLHNYMVAYPIVVGPCAWWAPEKAPDYLPLFAYLNTDAGKVIEGYPRLGISTFRFRGRIGPKYDGERTGQFIWLDCINHPIGSSFSCEGTPCDKGNIEILRYLSHFNLSGKKMEAILGCLVDMCFNLDVQRPGVTSTQLICACMYASLNRVITLNGSSMTGLTDIEKYAPGCCREVIKFVKFAEETYGVKSDIPVITARFIFSLMDEDQQKTVVDQVREQGGSASADNLATTESWWVSQEALQFISQKADNASTAQSQVAESKTSTTEKDNGTKQTTTSETKTESTQKTESQGKEDKDDDRDDTTSDDLTPGGDNSNSTGDDQASANDASGDDSSGETETSGEGSAAEGDDMPPEDEQMRTSDDDGIRFSIANPDSETSDSVMWREEVNNFLSNILTNPPEDLSPQDVATLTALQRFWLQHLSIETVVGILGSCLDRLPASLTKLISQIGDQKHE